MQTFDRGGAVHADAGRKLPRSLLMAGAGVRVAGAAVLAGLLWLAVFLALD